MQTLEAINKRHSTREFQGKLIAKDDLLKLLDAGRLAATARNEQPWEFVVVTEREKLQELARIAANNGPFLAEAACCVAVLCRDTKYYLEDGCAATENILIAAGDLGIGSCWVAGDKKPYCELVKRLLEAPAGLKLVSLIALGYQKENSLKTPDKRKLKEVIHWQKF